MSEEYSFLRKLKLSGIEDLNIYELLYPYFQFCMLKKWRFKLLHIFYRVIITLFRVNYSVEGNRKQIAIVYTRSVGDRNEHINNAQNLSDIIECSSFVKPSSGLSFNKYAILNLFHVFKWKTRINQVGKEKEINSLLIWRLYQIKSEGDYLFSKIKKYEVLLTYCDALSIDYYITFLGNRYGIKTVTVQHGIFPQNGFQYLHLHSKYFIANSVISKERAEEVGIKNIRVGGLISDLDLPAIDKSEKNGHFGVILDGMHSVNSTNKKENIEILKIAYDLCTKLNIKMIIRYHPSDILFENYIHLDLNFSNEYYELCPHNELLYDFFAHNDFIIVNKSTCLYSAINLLVPFCKYNSNNDIFSEIRINRFSRASDLIALVNKGFDKNAIIELRNELFGADNTNIQDNYKHIICDILEADDTPAST